MAECWPAGMPLEITGVSGRRYLVKKLLGKGGQVCAWLGVDEDTGEYVVIRVPRLDASPEMRKLQAERLRIAYRILYILYNAAVDAGLHIYYEEPRDYVEDSVAGFMLVTKYVEGEDLEAYTGCRRLSSLDDCRLLVTKLLDAVYYMHSVGVVHRDIKPRNVRKAPWGPVLIDFTTARYFYDITLLDNIHVYSLGGYTAPEQRMYGIASPPGDVWSLGATIAWLLTGKEPEKVFDFLGRRPPRVEEVERYAPYAPDLARLTAAMLNPDPGLRPAVIEEARTLLRGDVVEVAPAEVIVLGVKYRIEGYGSVCIGRSESCEVRIPAEKDPRGYVSGIHARIYWDSARKEWVIEDACSLNGTAVWRPGRDETWNVIWPGRKVKGRDSCVKGERAGRPLPLGRTALISLAFDFELGPYLILVFRAGPATIPSV